MVHERVREILPSTTHEIFAKGLKREGKSVVAGMTNDIVDDGRYGDRLPFVQSGWPGLRFMAQLQNYNRRHLPTDVLAHVNFGYLAQVARVDAASVVSRPLRERAPRRSCPVAH